MATHIDFGCPHCGAVNTFHVSRLGYLSECLRCDGKFVPPVPTARPAVPSPKPAKQSNAGLAIFLIAIILFVVVGFIVNAMSGHDFGAAMERHDAATVNKPTIICPDIGSVQTVRGIGSKPFAHCFRDRNAVIETFDSEESSDRKTARERLYLDGKVWPIQDRCTVRITAQQESTGLVMVKILDGAHSGETGWMFALECGGTKR